MMRVMGYSMPIYLKTSTATNPWRKVANLYLKTSTATNPWRKIVAAYIKTNDGWRSLFSSIVLPSIETRVTVSSSGGINSGSTIMNDSNPITLTSTRYHWNNADGFTYVWQKSPDNVTWTNIGTEQSTTNPASGSSSSSITRTLSGSNFTSGSDMYFRFVFYATNSTSGTSNSSESLPILISYYGTPVPAPGSPSITGYGTTGFTAYGNIGTWTNSPTSYDWRWFYNVGLNSGTLTYAGIKTVSSKSFSGQYATLTTTSTHGYKNGDYVSVSGVDTLFNGVGILQNVTANTFTYYVAPSNYSLTAAYTESSSFVSYSNNVYKALKNMPTPTTWSSSSSYSTGSFVTNNVARYVSLQSVPAGILITNTSYWQNIAPTNSIYWQVQSFSNVSSSGSTTAPNYYEGTSTSSTSFLLIVPETDYKTGYDLRGQVLGFGVKAYNQAALSPTEYTAVRFVYGYPVITLGTPTVSTTSAYIPYTQSYMTEYDIDVKYLGSSISGYPKTVTSPTSPIPITGLSAPRTYSYTVSPKNGEQTYGSDVTGSFTTIAGPTISDISISDTTLSPGSATNISTTSSGNTATTTWTNGSNTSVANLYSVSRSGTGGAGVNPTSLSTSGTFTITSTGNASITIRAINKTKRVNATWSQSNAQSYLIDYTVAGFGTNEIAGNSSDSNPSVQIFSTTSESAPVVTINSITVFSGIDNTGSSVVLSSSSSVTPTNKTTDTTDSNAVTYISAPSIPTITYSNITSSGFDIAWSSTNATSYNINVYDSITGNSVSGFPLDGTTQTSVSLSGLIANKSYSTTVTAINSAGNATKTETVKTLKNTALTPTFGTNTSNVGGFSGSVTNYDSNYTWSLSASSGTVSPTSFSGTGTTKSFTVTGLSGTDSSTVTVTTTRTNYFDGTADTTGSSRNAILYTVTFDANGGTGEAIPTSRTQTTEGGSIVIATKGTLEKSGYTFGGFNTNTSGTGTNYAVGDSYTPTSDVTLYAKWTLTPVASVSSITGSTGGRNTSNVWVDPKATMVYNFSNVTSATARIQRSLNNSTWTSGVTESLSISSNSATQTTNQPTGGTSTSGNYYYRAQVLSLNGVTLATPITSSSFQNTATAKSNISLYP